ncbi:MAG TPA: large conductance mechanosensitive channel protein MscL [Thermoanaerobaculia bacterium]|nr:large conductance mechanosensitive channel protein MscL [Thermoanaerobaculia bacterium]
MLREFREFAVRGNVVDMAVGVIIGAAFGAVVKSAVDDLVMPPLGLLTGGADFQNQFVVLRAGKTPAPYASLAEAKAAGASVLSYGVFLNQVVTFLLVALAVYLLVRAVNRLRRATEPPPTPARKCPFCDSAISPAATRCPHCTSELRAA